MRLIQKKKTKRVDILFLSEKLPKKKKKTKCLKSNKPLGIIK